MRIKTCPRSSGGAPSAEHPLFDNLDETLNVKQVASFFGVSDKTIYAKARDGLIPHQRVGNRYIFLRSELVRFLKGD